MKTLTERVYDYENFMKTNTATIIETGSFDHDGIEYVARKHVGSDDHWFAIAGSPIDSAPEFPEIEGDVVWHDAREV